MAARPQPPNTTENWPQSGRDLGLVVGPPGPTQRVPAEAQEPPRERETRRTAWILEQLLKTSFLKMCTPLECQAHFGQKGPQTERQSRQTAVFFVVALKVVRGGPKGRKSAPARFLRALIKIEPKTDTPKTMWFTMRNGFRATNGGPLFCKKRCASRAPVPF